MMSTRRGVGNFYEIDGSLQTGYFTQYVVNKRHPLVIENMVPFRTKISLYCNRLSSEQAQVDKFSAPGLPDSGHGQC